jgi:hypothetical protein
MTWSRILRYGHTLLVLALATWFCFAPGVLMLRALADPKLRGPGVPDLAWRQHQALTPRLERWARARVASGRAGHLALHDVPSTEWPMFGSVFYLWATEALQKAWDADHRLAPTPPREYARGAIEAATDLVLDPTHHTWVRTHWGDDYMHRENVFFRTLIISALTSRERLLGDGKHRALLREQTASLAAALDASATGLLDDYPDECYPIDVFAAVAAIKRAAATLGIDEEAFLRRERRAFSGAMLDERGLVPFRVDLPSGAHLQPARGTGNAFVSIFAPELWPDLAPALYQRSLRSFWAERWGIAGFREFPRELAGHDWGFDVDAGPILLGFSPAANAFGVGAARANGRLDLAYPLSAQMIAAAWPLPDGTFAGARLLSSQGHAPYVGEAAILWFLTQQPAPGTAVVTGGALPGLVYFGLALAFGSGLLLVGAQLRALRRDRRREAAGAPGPGAAQVAAWGTLALAAVALLALGQITAALVALLMTSWVARRRPRPTGAAPAPTPAGRLHRASPTNRVPGT